MNADERFSDELQRWLESDGPKSLGGLGDVFAEKSFAVAIVLLMIVSAAPIPTGGITLTFQVIASLIAAQMVLGRRSPWLPRRWRHRELGPTITGRAIPFVTRRIRWFEQHSHPRGAALFRQRVFIRFTGLVLLAFTIPAALAPPLTGLEILPAMGAAVVALSIILEDVVVYAVGVLVGTFGVVLFISVGAAVFRIFRNVF